MDVKSLYASERNKKKLLNEVYQHFLSICHNRIQLRHSVGCTSMTYMIPFFMIGYSLYDHSNATSYVKRKLIYGGFRVRHDNHALHVDWGRVAHEKKKRKGNKSNENHKR